MSFFGKIISNLSQAYSEINPATLTGAIDVIIVEKEDGSYICSPFHVRFGKMGVIRSKEKIVDIEINGTPVDIHMKLGDSGEAYFLEECDDDDDASDVEQPPSPTTVQSANNTKDDDDDDGAKSTQPNSDNSESHCDNKENGQSNEALLVIPTESATKSESVISVNASASSEKSASSQKRYRRKKKNRATSKPSAGSEATGAPPTTAATKAGEATESSAECDRESADDLLSGGREREVSSNHHYEDGELHPFSDSEVNTFNHHIYKKQESIGDPYDCKSDSEFEMFKSNSAAEKQAQQTHDSISWDWGELPKEKEASSSKKEAMSSANKSPRSSMLGGVLGFIIKDKEEATGAVTNEEDKGIYLDDLDPNDMNPEVAAKYFPAFANRSSSFSNARSNNASDEDAESGNGPSLSNSPQSVEFTYPQPDLSEFEEKGITSYDLATLSKVYHDMSMSLCGGIENLFENPSDTEHFLQSIISFDDFSESPLQIMNDPNLVIRMGGKYYTWKMASSIILALLMFQRPLPEKALIALKDQCIPKKKITAQNSTSSWRYWFRSNLTESNSTIEESNANMVDGAPANGLDTRSLNSTSSTEELAKLDTSTKSQRSNTLEYTSDEETLNIVLNSNKPASEASTPSAAHANKKVKFRKVLRLKSEVVKSLNLRRNCNDAMFSVTTAFQGTTMCRSKIFLWRYDDKVVISDIDGTITKSDVLGHILPYIGKDWAQIGVTSLYSNIENNGYKFLYLSARAIGQAKTTRDYLRALRQDDIGLPDGPLLLSPTSLFSALHREVIEKKPEEFKISCLKDIQTLFPSNPFFAGFGNKINDNWAYKAVGIDSSRIFTINPKGELKLEKIMSFKSSYTDLSQFVDQMFPPLQQHAYYEGYSSFMFWRPDLPILEDREIDAKDEV